MTSAPKLPCLYLSIGPSGAGKSTFAKAWAAQDSRIAVVSTDAKRKELFGDEAIQKDGALVFDQCAWDAAALLSLGKDVIFDATNTTAYGRSQLLFMVSRKYSLPFKKAALIFLPDEQVAVYRNGLRERHVPQKVIRRQYSQFWRDIQSLPDEVDEVYMIEGGKENG